MRTACLRVKGNYSRFLEKKEEYLDAQGKRQDALANRVHTELEWLRRGPRARRTKAKARIDKAHEMIGELADLNSRSRTATAKIDFSATEPANQAAHRAGWRHLRHRQSHACSKA